MVQSTQDQQVDGVQHGCNWYLGNSKFLDSPEFCTHCVITKKNKNANTQVDSHKWMIKKTSQ
jgi:hypothetical protein